MGRPLFRPWLRPPRRRRLGLLPAALVGVGLALLFITAVDGALRPTVSTLARTRARNAVTAAVNDAVNQTLANEAVAYQDLVTVERDANGQVTMLSADPARLNALRVQILDSVLRQVENLDSQALGVHLGALTGFSIASDWGPVLPVQVRAAAAPEADFENVFTSAGINQTIHQIVLDVRVDVTLLIPGGAVDTTVSTQVPVAETLLVGQVPDAYLELPGTP